MARGISILYVLIVVFEVGVLSRIYVTDPPAPSDPLSIWLGWGGLGSMIIMLVYVFARRSKTLRRWAPLSAWLNFHIFMGVQGVIFVFFHSVHIFSRDWQTYWTNPAVINFFAVMIVFSSGIFGRYLYSMLPKTSEGERMEIADARIELAAMTDRMPAEIADKVSFQRRAGSMVSALHPSIGLRSMLQAVNRYQLEDDVKRALKRRLYLESRLLLKNGAHRFFKWWIILHRPLSSVMYILSILHVVLTYMFTPSLAAP